MHVVFFLTLHFVVFSIVQREKAFQNMGKKLSNVDIEKIQSRPLLEVLDILYRYRKLFETYLIVCIFRGVIIFIHLQQDCKYLVRPCSQCNGVQISRLRTSFTWCNPLETNALKSTACKRCYS